MRVIFETAPVPATAPVANGRTALGLVVFQAKIFEPGEPGSVWPNGHPLVSVSDWLRDAKPDGTLLIGAPSIHPGVPAVTIPAAVLNALPPDVGMAMEWWWSPR
jgi:hypothetical protein